MTKKDASADRKRMF